ncbi:hypothetical protein IAH97_03325 [Neoehrlichia mikurensis]|uniref:Uncharacterized protein n=1 Tax=Neoehrlichia mikurensis TaxID=89586 RepID=A0ABY5EYR6_9RICK|nr:hypothetical protein [Neoehrlichia mikurensis]QXK91770.1 hypothetical protein IAH97_03325 [Neoehrlichia mikurensis]UTO56506.1 hypothetical protein LUA81_00615 [Neoehrlichia mikurensis]
MTDDYKDIVKQYMETVKEIVGDSKTFDEIFSSIMKIQEKALVSSNKENNNQGDVVQQITDNNVINDDAYQKLLDEIKIIKKRLIRLERKVLQPKVE